MLIFNQSKLLRNVTGTDSGPLSGPGTPQDGIIDLKAFGDKVILLLNPGSVTDAAYTVQPMWWDEESQVWHGDPAEAIVVEKDWPTQRVLTKGGSGLWPMVTVMTNVTNLEIRAKWSASRY